MNNDLISREVLKETARAKFGDDITSITLFKVFEELIDDAPTVEPKKPQGDLISREALKEAINANECRHSHYFEIFKIIDNAPTIESDSELKEKIESYKNAYRIMSDAFENEVVKNQRPQGKWTIVNDVYCECPFCKNREVKFSKHCPECGARLKGGAE